jgi:hypothetical protein
MQRPALFGVVLIGLSVGLAISFRSIGLWALPSALVLFAIGVLLLFVSAWRTRGNRQRGSSHGDDAAWGGGYLSGASSKHPHTGHDSHGSHSSDHGGGDGGGDGGGGGGD